MAGPLGCPETYTVAFHNNTGAIPAGEALEVADLEWSRVLDDTSTAKATIPITSAECCDQVSRVNTWCNDLSIYRDDRMVWQGPVTELDQGSDELVVSAQDVTAWLFHTEVATARNWTTAAGGLGALDLARIAETLLRDALTAPDAFDPGILLYLSVADCGVVGERAYEALQTYVGDEWKELARGGLDYTALGHRIIVAGEMPLARLPQLDDEAFLDELRLIEDGLSAVSKAIVHGEGVTAVAGAAGACGKLTRIVKEDGIKDLASAQAEANALVAAGTPTPLVLDVPDGLALSPEAPVGIMDLVPGVIAPVTSEALCRRVAADLRLTKLTVSYSASSTGAGESVKVSMSSPGAVDPAAAA